MSAIDHDALEAAIRADRDGRSALLAVCKTWRPALFKNGLDPAERDGPVTRSVMEAAVEAAQELLKAVGLADLRAAFLASREEARQLRAERERLREALEFYATDHRNPNEGPWGWLSDDFGQRARAALSPTFDQRDPGDETPERPGNPNRSREHDEAVMDLMDAGASPADAEATVSAQRNPRADLPADSRN